MFLNHSFFAIVPTVHFGIFGMDGEAEVSSGDLRSAHPFLFVQFLSNRSSHIPRSLNIAVQRVSVYLY